MRVPPVPLLLPLRVFAVAVSVAAVAASGAPAAAAAEGPPRLAIAVDRPLVERLRSDPQNVAVAAGEGLTAWTIGSPRRSRLFVGGDEPTRPVAPGLRFAVSDVGHTTGGRPVAVGLGGPRARPLVVGLASGRHVRLKVPRSAGTVTAIALDHGRVLLGTTDASRSAGRPALWVGRLGERGDVRRLRRWRYGPKGTTVTRLSSSLGQVSVDVLDPRFDDDTEYGYEGQTFVGTTGGRWRRVGTAHYSVSSAEYVVSTLGVLPGGRWALVRTEDDSLWTTLDVVPVAGGRFLPVSADTTLARLLPGHVAAMAIDDDGRLVVVSEGVGAEPALPTGEPNLFPGGPALAPSILRTTPLLEPPAR